MSWPTVIDVNAPVISTITPDCLVTEISTGAITSGGGAVWPAANLALFIPIRITRPYLAAQMFWFTSTAGTDSVDVGIYDNQGNRLVSSGTVALAGSAVIQSTDITDTTINPGLYYLAMAVNGTTNAVFSFANNATAPIPRAFGCYEMTTAFNLPATATFAGSTRALIPLIGVTSKTVI